ncbi:MAG: DUF4440 domain-containing protein [Chitinophagaceae bacterium]|nr:DUF4440 domain-containing protein [Chitinophagaceae bacterium]
MNKVISVVFFLILAAGCNTKKNNAAKDDLITTDLQFSEMSRQHGMKKAFIEYIENEGVLLRPNHPPIVGADAIEFLSQSVDSSYTLTWKPSAADIAVSGDLGYTYGIYTLHLRDTAMQGTYVSIWKKQSDGKWKFVVDSGNPGITSIKQ